MNTTLRVLIVEDSADDALLVVRELEKGGYAVESQRVETPKEMSAALKRQTWDIVLSDYRMPHFSGPDALKLLQSTKLDIPFVIISGKIGEETAVELMLAGADDYVVKTNLKRLVPAVQREMREAEVHRERQRAEEQIISQSKFATENPHPVIRVNRECVILFHNKASLPLLRYWQSEIGKRLPKDWCRLVEVVYKNGISKTAEVKYEDRVYLLNVVPVKDNDYINIYAAEITDLKSAEAWVQHLNQVLLTLRKVNQLIVATNDEKELLQKTCEALVDGRNYSLARIGLTIEGSFDIRWAAQHGFGKDFTTNIKVTWDDSEYGQGPAGKAIKTGQAVVIEDITTDEGFRPWHDSAIKFGIVSLCALPLVVRNKTVGMLVVYSDKKDAFIDDEIELLKELSGDVSLGIQKIRQQNEIRQAEAKYVTLVESSNDVTIILQNARVVFTNASMDKMTGYATSDILGKPFIEFVCPEYRELVIERYKKRLAGEAVPSRYEIELITGDNKSLAVDISASAIEYEGKPADMAVIRDISERKQAEEKLRESEEFNTSLLQNAPHAINVINPDFSIRYVNPALEKLTGFSFAEVVGEKPPYPWKAEGIQEDYLPLFHDSVKKGNVAYERLLHKKNGELLWIEFSLTAVKDNGKLKYYISNWTNITERKRAEKILRDSEERLKEAQSLGRITNYEVDHLTRKAIWSDEMYELFERDKKLPPPTAKEIPSYFSPEEYAKFADLRRIAAEEGKEAHGDITARLPSGKTPVFHVSVRPVKDDKGQLVKVFGVIQDITERKQAEEALRESERDLREAQSLGRIGSWEFDPATQKITWSDETYVLYERDKALGPPSAEEEAAYYPPAEAARLKELARLVTEKGEDTYYEASAKLPSGKTVLFYCSMRPVKDETGNVVKLFGTVQDITERKQAEEELKFRAQLLDAATDAILVLNNKNDIVYFNEAVCRSRGYAREEMNGKKLLDIVAPEYLKLISSQVNREVGEKGEAIFESIELCKDNSITPVEIHSRIIKLGGQEYIVNISRDITQRKQADNELKQSYEKLQKTLDGVITAMAATIEIRDPYTAGHQRQTAQLVRAIAQEMGLPQEQVNGIYTAGLIHDIGKVGIPSDILSKPGKLSEIEFSLIKAHSQIGYDVLKNIDFPYPVAQWILQHHERVNGSGYPAGLTGDKISLEAKILAVADVVDAMASHRPYRAALGIAVALEEISRQKNILYDVAVVDACVRLFKEKGYQLKYSWDNNKMIWEPGNFPAPNQTTQ